MIGEPYTEYPQEQPLFECDWCTTQIYHGDAYYKIDTDRVCAHCIEEAKYTAERQGYEPDEDIWRDR